jgi:lipopolysaccharide/colanic/teichoic acid biosynthesis glycosyltransferase
MDGQELVPIADNYKKRPDPAGRLVLCANGEVGTALFSPDALAAAKAVLLNRPDQFLGWRARESAGNAIFRTIRFRFLQQAVDFAGIPKLAEWHTN